jgi:hypothetical protein
LPERVASAAAEGAPKRVPASSCTGSRSPVSNCCSCTPAAHSGPEGLGRLVDPEGRVCRGRDPLTVAKREFEEETGARPEATSSRSWHIVQAGRKIVTAWAVEGDFDPPTRSRTSSSWNGRPAAGARSRFRKSTARNGSLPPPPAGKSSRLRASSSPGC